jgi:arsenate reductase
MKPQSSDPEILRYQEAGAKGKKTVLFICSGNAVRSQMAEALVNHFLGERWVAFSAGTMPMKVHPQVLEVLKEIGVLASRQKTKHLDTFQGLSFDRIITLCSDADRACTYFWGLDRKEHLPFSDPLESGALGWGSKGLFRKLRDEMKEKLIRLLGES